MLFRSLVPLMRMHGFDVGTGTFSFKEQEHIDLPTRLDMDLKLAEKISIDEAYFYETYNIPAPASSALRAPSPKEKGNSQKV